MTMNYCINKIRQEEKIMTVIALFCPAFIAMSIKLRRGLWKKTDIFSVIMEYGKTVLWCNLFTVSIITYILRIQQVTSVAFESFSFFSKYVIIAMCCSFFMPYMQEYIKKYIEIRFYLKDKNEE